MRLIIWIGFWVLFASNVIAQNYSVLLHEVANNKTLFQEVRLPPAFPDGIKAYSFIREIIPCLQEKGYLGASLDSVVIKEKNYHAYIFIGKKYQWAQLDVTAIPQEVLAANGWAALSWQHQILKPKQIARLAKKTLEWAEENGYPFARFWLDIQPSSDENIRATAQLDKGLLQKIDSIHIESESKISRNYLLRFLDMEQGEIYNEKKIQNISSKIASLSFLQEDKPPEMIFKPYRNQLNIYLKERKSNTLNAIIGLLPNSVETGKFLLTADAAFSFMNILGRGESINITYKNLQYKSPRFRAQAVYPYLFNTPIGIDASFELFKKDTSFRRTGFQGGLRYQLSANSYVKAFYQNQSNRLGTIDTQYVKANKKLPENADISAKGGGLEIGFAGLDNLLQPRKGYETKLTGTVLQRKVEVSDAVANLSDGSGFNYAALYDSLRKGSRQLHLSGSFAYYFPLQQAVVLKTQYNGGYMHGKNFFKNELYQIGGFKLLRGFDEQSIYTNHYHVVSAELRLLLGENSYFFLFSDNGYVETKFAEHNIRDFYNGFGVGTTLETKNGIFSISYALGRHKDYPIQFRQSKIHFGYAAFF